MSRTSKTQDDTKAAGTSWRGLDGSSRGPRRASPRPQSSALAHPLRHAHGAPAKQAGSRAGDDVESIDDTPIVGAGAGGPAIIDIVHGGQPGQHLRFKVRRSGAQKVIDIVAGVADRCLQCAASRPVDSLA